MSVFLSKVFTDHGRILKDYLEIKYTTNQKEQDEIITRLLLLSPLQDECEIHLIDGIIYYETLLIIKDSKDCNIKNVYILDKQDKKHLFVKNFDSQNSVVGAPC